MMGTNFCRRYALVELAQGEQIDYEITLIKGNRLMLKATFKDRNILEVMKVIASRRLVISETIDHQDGTMTVMIDTDNQDKEVRVELRATKCFTTVRIKQLLLPTMHIIVTGIDEYGDTVSEWESHDADIEDTLDAASRVREMSQNTAVRMVIDVALPPEPGYGTW